MKNRKRNRMQGYDYSRDNIYFVTICVQDTICCFGKIVSSLGGGRDLPLRDALPVQDAIPRQNVELILNEYGLIVKDRILWLESQYPYVKIHNHVVMPNHVHILIEINRNRVVEKDIKIKSLSSLMGALKTTSSKLIHLSGFLVFSWQRSFHDSIVKSKQGFLRISNYINSNPQNWYNDSLKK